MLWLQVSDRSETENIQSAHEDMKRRFFFFLIISQN